MDEFLAPAFEAVEADYAEKMIASAASTDPRAPEVIARLANGIKVARQVRAQIEAIVADGLVADAERTREGREKGMSAAKLRLMKIGTA